MIRSALLLLILVVVQLGTRYGGWLWVSVTEPHALILTQGHTVEYESTYVHGVVEGMLGWTRPTIFTTTSYRFWLPQFGAAAILRWTGDAYWALAIVEIVGAWLGAIGMLVAARALDLGRRVAALAGALFALSPCIVAYMWRNQLQVQASGSVALALGVSLAGLLGNGPAWRKACLLAGVWLTASLQYQFHVVVMLVVLALSLSEKRHLRERLLIVAGAAAGWGVLTLLMQMLPLAAGYPTVPENNDPRVMLDSFVGRVSSGGLGEIGRALVAPLITLNKVYHPLMLALMVMGLATGAARLRVVGAATLAATYGFLVIRDLDRVAFAAAPAIYLAAASAIVQTPVAARRWLRERTTRAAVRTWSVAGLSAALWVATLFVVVRTNSDLWRDYGYVFASSEGRLPR